jgi:hypothetical protein
MLSRLGLGTLTQHRAISPTFWALSKFGVIHLHELRAMVKGFMRIQVDSVTAISINVAIKYVNEMEKC